MLGVQGGDCGVVVTLGEFCGREVSVEFGMKGLALALRGEGGGCGLRVGIAGELCGVRAGMVGVMGYGWLIVPRERRRKGLSLSIGGDRGFNAIMGVEGLE